ncbi:MAG: hypothetical protein ACI8QZ_002800 [Chlamydiales bacterium]|jgi:hypothetical protein
MKKVPLITAAKNRKDEKSLRALAMSWVMVGVSVGFTPGSAGAV